MPPVPSVTSFNSRLSTLVTSYVIRSTVPPPASHTTNLRPSCRVDGLRLFRVYRAAASLSRSDQIHITNGETAHRFRNQLDSLLSAEPSNRGGSFGCLLSCVGPYCWHGHHKVHWGGSHHAWRQSLLEHADEVCMQAREIYLCELLRRLAIFIRFARLVELPATLVRVELRRARSTHSLKKRILFADSGI